MIKIHSWKSSRNPWFSAHPYCVFYVNIPERFSCGKVNKARLLQLVSNCWSRPKLPTIFLPSEDVECTAWFNFENWRFSASWNHYSAVLVNLIIVLLVVRFQCCQLYRVPQLSMVFLICIFWALRKLLQCSIWAQIDLN